MALQDVNRKLKDTIAELRKLNEQLRKELEEAKSSSKVSAKKPRGRPKKGTTTVQKDEQA